MQRSSSVILRGLMSDFQPLVVGLPGTTTVVSALRFSFVTELEATQVRAVLSGGVTGVWIMEEFVDRCLPW